MKAASSARLWLRRSRATTLARKNRIRGTASAESLHPGFTASDLQTATFHALRERRDAHAVRNGTQWRANRARVPAQQTSTPFAALSYHENGVGDLGEITRAFVALFRLSRARANRAT